MPRQRRIISVLGARGVILLAKVRHPALTNVRHPALTMSNVTLQTPKRGFRVEVSSTNCIYR